MHWRIHAALGWGKDRIEDTLLSFVTRRVPLPASVADKRIILVGASVGRAWRLHLVFPNVRALALYEFDKSPLVRRAIADRPDAIIIKECAAYFPSDGVRRDLVASWVQQIRAADIRPVLATVVPVTRGHALRHPGRAEAIWEFNDHLRELAAAQQVPLLDLEAAVRSSARERYLDDGLDTGDGLHLARATYRRHLDSLIPPLLLRTFHGEPEAR
jgi:hypothetical protein